MAEKSVVMLAALTSGTLVEGALVLLFPPLGVVPPPDELPPQAARPTIAATAMLAAAAYL
jgi:hypothetical protein